MKKKYEIGETFDYSGTTLKVVEDDPQREDNCEICFLDTTPDCRSYPCCFEDRPDNTDVHYEEV